MLKGCVEALVRVVVVAEDGVEHDAGVEERLVGDRELARHVRRGVGPVDVVAEQDHEVEAERVVARGHLLRHVAPSPRVPPDVADHRKADGAVSSGAS